MNHSTELVFILDKSGSMHGLQQDTLGGYNGMLAKQRELDGECRITTVLFNHESSIVHDRAGLDHVRPMTIEQYQPSGYTALLDSIGMTINRIGTIQKNSPPQQRASKVMVVIITDGQENASWEFSLPHIRHMIERQQQRFGWEFIFLGANIDAIDVAASYGISAKNASTYVADSQGTVLNFDVINEAVQDFRRGRSDYHQRLDAIRWDQRMRG